jgi:hypothetical protein
MEYRKQFLPNFTVFVCGVLFPFDNLLKYLLMLLLKIIDYRYPSHHFAGGNHLEN